MGGGYGGVTGAYGASAYGAQGYGGYGTFPLSTSCLVLFPECLLMQSDCSMPSPLFDQSGGQPGGFNQPGYGQQAYGGYQQPPYGGPQQGGIGAPQGNFGGQGYNG